MNTKIEELGLIPTYSLHLESVFRLCHLASQKFFGFATAQKSKILRGQILLLDRVQQFPTLHILLHHPFQNTCISVQCFYTSFPLHCTSAGSQHLLKLKQNLWMFHTTQFFLLLIMQMDLSFDLNRNNSGITHLPLSFQHTFIISPVVSSSLLKINLTPPMLPLSFWQQRPLSFSLTLCNSNISSNSALYNLTILSQDNILWVTLAKFSE